MSKITIADKVLLESVLKMAGGYVLDFSNASFVNFFQDLGIDVYDAAAYPGFGDSKANRLRAFWKSGTDADVSRSLVALADYVEAKMRSLSPTPDVTEFQIQHLRSVAKSLANPTDPAVKPRGPSASFTTDATVNANKIQIEIHEDIYNHIAGFLANGDYFHAVEESYKVVREALRVKTGREKATDAFKPENEAYIFGHASTSPTEKDFFDGVKYLNMAIQFLRNEKSHTLAAPIERNLALHYVSLASLSYDLITRYVSDELVSKIEDLVTEERRRYTASRFYRAFKAGKWLAQLTLPAEFESMSVRRVLRDKWMGEIDLTHSYDHSNIMLMRLQLVADHLSREDLDGLLDLPTHDENGYYQGAGLPEFLSYVQESHPDKISVKAARWMAANVVE